MSIQVNIGDHVSPIAGFIAWPPSKVRLINWSRSRAKRITRDIASADPYFRTLPGGRSLSSILQDRSVWINYHATMNAYGGAIRNGSELCISNTACRIGRWTVLATLIHELAHINGAPGGASKAAEEALLHTGLGKKTERTTGVDDPETPYDPSISG